MNKQLVSIILPVYNGQDFIGELLTSIRNQTYSNYEVVIVDDASKDNTAQIVTNFCQKDHRFKIFNNVSNLKLPKSLNKGHELANGDLMTWISHDNILKPNFLKVLVQNILNKNADFVYSNYDIIYSDGALKREHITKSPAHLPFGNVIGASFMYSRKLYEKLGGFNDELYLVEDYDFWLRGLCNFNFFHIDENLYQYRLHKGSLTSDIANKSEFKQFHKIAINQMFLDLMKFNGCNLDYASMLSDLYFKNVGINLVESLLLFKKDGGKIFMLNQNEWEYEVDKQVRQLLLRGNIPKPKLAKFLFMNPKLLSLVHNKKRTLQLLGKLIK
jgi:glycosyltransferase involved in cell wall biosynthesis